MVGTTGEWLFMNAILLYTREWNGNVSFEFNLYDNQFATENLAVRKVLMAMMDSVRDRLDRLMIEYNDGMLAEKMGAKKAGELLRFLGAAKDNLREHKENGVVITRSFETELTGEKYDFFYNLADVARIPHYRMKERDEDRVVFYYSRYLQLIAPAPAADKFLGKLSDFSLPYRLVPIGGQV